MLIVYINCSIKYISFYFILIKCPMPCNSGLLRVNVCTRLGKKYCMFFVFLFSKFTAYEKKTF